MNVDDLIVLTQNKLLNLSNSLAAAYNQGDLDNISKLEKDISETQLTLDKLKGVL